ncbi:MAG: tail fiber domain-containing protein, partial [Bacteroidetes bacterium]|nr:tail fiber domain-containing protein [Bacteroidota bacterium]
KLGYLSSSKRYKKDISDMENVDWLYELHPINYVYRNDDSKVRQYGLIAEEVEQVNPLFVSYNETGSPETVMYSKLISPMVKALQEQEKEKAEMKAEIESLKSENKQLKARVARIELQVQSSVKNE